MHKIKMFMQEKKYSQTSVQWPPLGPWKSGRYKEVPDKSEIYTGRWWQKPVAVNRWPLFRDGCLGRFDCIFKSLIQI